MMVAVSWWRYGPSSPNDGCCRGYGRSCVASYSVRDDVTVLRRQLRCRCYDSVSVVSRFIYHHTTPMMTSFTERVPGDSHKNFHNILSNSSAPALPP